MLADPDNDAGWFGRFTHYDFLLLAGGQAGFIVGRTLVLIGQPSRLTDYLVILSLIVFLLGARAQHRHIRHPCEKCIADMPLDAQAQADRKRLSLKLHHLSESKAWTWGQVALLALAWLAPAWLTTTLLFVIGTSMVVEFVAAWQHRPLQLVCPWCWHRRGWDDDEEPDRTPTPDPVGAKEA